MNRIDRFFVVTTSDGQEAPLVCPTRPAAEHAALQRFGADVTVRELSVVEWRRWKEQR